MLSSCRTTQRYVRLLCISLEGELGLYFITELLSLLILLDYFSFASAFPHCLSLLFGTWGRPRRQKPFSTNKKQGTWWGVLLYQGGPCRVLLSFNHLFSLTLLHPEGNRDKTRKGIQFWMERLIINTAGELHFSGTQFHPGHSHFWVATNLEVPTNTAGLILFLEQLTELRKALHL